MTERSVRALLQRFGQFADRFADGFNRHTQRDAASQYIDALVNNSERKSGMKRQYWVHLLRVDVGRGLLQIRVPQHLLDVMKGGTPLRRT